MPAGGVLPAARLVQDIRVKCVQGGVRKNDPTGKSPERFLDTSVQSLLKKYSDFQKCQISPAYRRLVPTRGALRGRHERWVRDAVDVEVPLTNGTEADGEVVWS
jgi:hypothetical protein